MIDLAFTRSNEIVSHQDMLPTLLAAEPALGNRGVIVTASGGSVHAVDESRSQSRNLMPFLAAPYAQRRTRRRLHVEGKFMSAFPPH